MQLGEDVHLWGCGDVAGRRHDGQAGNLLVVLLEGLLNFQLAPLFGEFLGLHLEQLFFLVQAPLLFFKPLSFFGAGEAQLGVK